MREDDGKTLATGAMSHSAESDIGPAVATLSTMSAFPAPAPFVVATDVDATRWIDERLQPFRRLPEGVLVGEIVPSGFEAYARLFHPARRFFGPSIEQSTSLRWSEIAAARNKKIHPEMQIEALIDKVDAFDNNHWRAISSGEGEWSPPDEGLEETEAIAVLTLLRPFTATPNDAWFMLWDGYGDLGPEIDPLPRGMIHPDRSGTRLPQGMDARTPALRHYLVFRGPLDGLREWYRWRNEGPNYWWPADRAWVVVTEIDGFSSYVGASAAGIDTLLASPLVEALPSALSFRFDVWGDTVNRPPPT